MKFATTKCCLTPLLAALTFTIGFSAHASTSTSVICITKSGEVFVRPKCKSGETKASLSQFAKQGQQGAKGPAGTDGVAPILGRNVVFSGHSVSVTALSTTTVSEACPTGQVSVGGGCTTNNSNLELLSSYPFDVTPNEWRCHYANNSVSTVNAVVTPLVICANTTAP
jgi:hypothetical protein